MMRALLPSMLALFITACSSPPSPESSTHTVLRPDTVSGYRSKADHIFTDVTGAKLREDGPAGRIAQAMYYSFSDDPAQRALGRTLLVPLAKDGYIVAQKRLAWADSLGRCGVRSDEASHHYLAGLHHKAADDIALEKSMARDKQLVLQAYDQLSPWYRQAWQSCPNRDPGLPSSLSSDKDYLDFRAMFDCLISYGASDAPAQRLQALAGVTAIRCEIDGTSSGKRPCAAEGYRILASGKVPDNLAHAQQESLLEALSILYRGEFYRFMLQPDQTPLPLGEKVQWEMQYATQQITDGHLDRAKIRLETVRSAYGLSSIEQVGIDLMLGEIASREHNDAEARTLFMSVRRHPQLSLWRQQQVDLSLVALSARTHDPSLGINILLDNFARLPERERLLPASLYQGRAD